MRLRDTATRLRGVVEDGPYAGETDGEVDWTTPVEADLTCEIQFEQSTERSQDQETVIGTWTGYFLPDADLLHTDRLRYRGMLFTVNGQVPPFAHRGSVHHFEVPLKFVGA